MLIKYNIPATVVCYVKALVCLVADLRLPVARRARIVAELSLLPLYCNAQHINFSFEALSSAYRTLIFQELLTFKYFMEKNKVGGERVVKNI